MIHTFNFNQYNIKNSSLFLCQRKNLMLININIMDMERHTLIYLFVSMVGGYLRKGVK
jgi:hypothetical protein